MDFIPNTGKDQAAMLERIGVRSAEELYEVETLGRKLAIPDGMAEQELKETVKGISQKNRDMPVFRGAGSYSHFIPAVVRHMTSRSEFYTAYTPYQPEMSQGILQAIYEYQSMVCDLTGMDVSNASVYDGATACAEAMAMAVAHSRGKNKVLVSKAVSPFYRMVLRTYAEAGDIKLIEISCPAGRTPDLNIDEKTAAVIVQSPNFFGIVEDVKNISAQAHERGTLLIQAISDATSLGLFKSPGEMSADIVAAEGQAFGIPQSFGGPYLGMMACRKELTRMLPGRIVGKTVDSEGKKGFVLTLQAREQHIRREKALSNICSNEALCMLSAAVYLASAGKNIRNVAKESARRAHLLKSKLLGLKMFEEVFKDHFYHEFVIRCDDAGLVNRKLLAHGFVGGLELEEYYSDMKGCLLFCATESTKLEDIDRLAKLLEGM